MSIARFIRKLLRQKPKGTVYSATHGRIHDLRAAMAAAEVKLGLRCTASGVDLRCEPGAERIGPYWGVRKSKDSIVAGTCDPLGARRYRIVAYCDPATMAPHPYTLQHECAHVLLFEAGVPHADHHARFRKVGIP